MGIAAFSSFDNSMLFFLVLICFLLPLVLPASGGKLVGYLPGYKETSISPQELTNAGYTHVICAFATFNASNQGALVNEFSYIQSPYIKALQKAGIKVMVSIGGAIASVAGATVNFHDISQGPSFVAKFVNNIQQMVTQYGFDGVDFDLEQGFTSDGSPSDVDILARCILTLNKVNPKLLISIVPQTANIAPQQTGNAFRGIYSSYSNLAMQTYQALAWSGVQIYNTGGMNGINNVLYSNADPNNVDFSVAMAVDMLEDWPSKTDTGQPTGFPPYKAVLRDDQVLLGYPAPNSAGNSDGSPAKPNSVIKKILTCLTNGAACDTYTPPKHYPNLGGVFTWELTYDQANNWKFGSELKSCVKNGDCQ